MNTFCVFQRKIQMQMRNGTINDADEKTTNSETYRSRHPPRERPAGRHPDGRLQQRPEARCNHHPPGECKHSIQNLPVHRIDEEDQTRTQCSEPPCEQCRNEGLDNRMEICKSTEHGMHIWEYTCIPFFLVFLGQRLARRRIDRYS